MLRFASISADGDTTIIHQNQNVARRDKEAIFIFNANIHGWQIFCRRNCSVMISFVRRNQLL